MMDKKSKLRSLIFNNIILLKQIFIYGIIGATTASIDSIVFIMLQNINLNKYLANFISINIGILLSFILNTYLNFKVTDNLLKRGISFFSVGYFGMLLSMIILYIGTDIFKFNSIVIKLFSVIVVAAFQFVLNKLITYKKGAK